MRLVGGFLLDAPDMDGSVPDVPLVPVLAHQQEAFGRFVEHVQEHPDKPVRRPERFFEDTPNPWPPQIHLVALRAAVAARSFRWVDLEAPVGLAVGVERLRANANSVPPRRTPNESAR